MDARRKWDYTLAEIAEAAGVSVHTVRDAKQGRRLEPGDLGSVLRFVAGYKISEWLTGQQ